MGRRQSSRAGRVQGDGWTRHGSPMRAFNGLVCSTFRDGREFGVFNEKHPIAGMRWSVRTRPIDANGTALDCWGRATPYHTKSDAVESVR